MDVDKEYVIKFNLKALDEGTYTIVSDIVSDYHYDCNGSANINVEDSPDPNPDPNPNPGLNHDSNPVSPIESGNSDEHEINNMNTGNISMENTGVPVVVLLLCLLALFGLRRKN